jgi:hypothetical protein
LASILFPILKLPFGIRLSVFFRPSTFGLRICGPSDLIQDPAEILVAGLVLDVEAKLVALPIKFGADDGFDAGFGSGLGEFDRAVQIVFVG